MEIDFNLIDKIIELVKEAYNEAKEIKNKNIRSKELNDIVTDVDIFMENKICEAIKE